MARVVGALTMRGRVQPVACAMLYAPTGEAWVVALRATGLMPEKPAACQSLRDDMDACGWCNQCYKSTRGITP